MDYWPYVKVTDCRNTLIVMKSQKCFDHKAKIEKINDNVYWIKSVGGFGFYKKSEKKKDNIESLKKSFARLKALINCNYESPENVLFITLTYAENMTDNALLKDDLKQFFKKMRRRWKFEYIYTKEQQGRGAWHLHIIFFFAIKAPHIENSLLRKIWGHGFVNIQGFKSHINNLGNYLCAYLTESAEKSKKGARLLNYESGIRLYNCSAGIKRPETFYVTYFEYLELIEGKCLLSDKKLDLRDTAVNNVFEYELYAAK